MGRLKPPPSFFFSYPPPLFGLAWVCLGSLGFAWVCLGLLGIAWAGSGLPVLARACLDLLGLAWPCLAFFGCELAERNGKHNAERTANLSNIYTKNHQFGTPFSIIFGAMGHLGATLGSQRLRCAFQVSFFTDFVSQWGPHWGPKNHIGGLRVAI